MFKIRIIDLVLLCFFTSVFLAIFTSRSRNSQTIRFSIHDLVSSHRFCETLRSVEGNTTVINIEQYETLLLCDFVTDMEPARFLNEFTLRYADAISSELRCRVGLSQISESEMRIEIRCGSSKNIVLRSEIQNVDDSLIKVTNDRMAYKVSLVAGCEEKITSE